MAKSNGPGAPTTPFAGFLRVWARGCQTRRSSMSAPMAEIELRMTVSCTLM